MIPFKFDCLEPLDGLSPPPCPGATTGLAGRNRFSCLVLVPFFRTLWQRERKKILVRTGISKMAVRFLAESPKRQLPRRAHSLTPLERPLQKKARRGLIKCSGAPEGPAAHNNKARQLRLDANSGRMRTDFGPIRFVTLYLKIQDNTALCGRRIPSWNRHQIRLLISGD